MEKSVTIKNLIIAAAESVNSLEVLKEISRTTHEQTEHFRGFNKHMESFLEFYSRNVLADERKAAALEAIAIAMKPEETETIIVTNEDY